MKVGDLVKFRGSIGVIVEIHGSYPHGTAEVQWTEGDRYVMSRNVLKVIEQNGHFLSST